MKLICLLSMTLSLSITAAAFADSRSDALAVTAKLQHELNSQISADEIRSIDSSLATAEMYYQLNDKKNAERYYRLTIQKVSLINSRIAPPDKAEPIPIIKQEQQVNTTIDANEADKSGKFSKKTVPIFTETSAPSSNLDTGVPSINDGQEYLGSTRLTGGVGTYRVIKGDTIRIIAAKLGISRYKLASMNNLDTKQMLKEGQLLRYNNRRIIPEHRLKDGIVINIPDRMLYLFKQGNMTFSTAVALGTPTKTGQFLWQTPIGRFKIVNKAKNPTWTVPPSIQEEMRLEGKNVITSIPPGKDNPLGKYAIKTSLPGILIHSTTKPWSIYTYASHGCIRVYPSRMEELFKLVSTHSPGEIIYKPVKLAVTDDGRILLEAHGDIYNKTEGLTAEAQMLIRRQKLEDKVDWKKVRQVISNRNGVAEDITKTPAETKNNDFAKQDQSPT